MVIRVSEIPEEGLRLEGPEAFPEPFQDRAWRLEDIGLAVEKDGDVVFVNGRVRSRVPQVCSRCLESYDATVDATVDTRLVPAPVRGQARAACRPSRPRSRHRIRGSASRPVAPGSGRGR